MRRDRSNRFSGVWQRPQETSCIALITDNGHRVPALDTRSWRGAVGGS